MNKGKELWIFVRTQLITAAVLLVGFSAYKTSPWYENKIHDILMISGVFLIQFISGMFPWLFRPITIDISQENSLTKGSETVILFENNRVTTPQPQRYINLKVEVSRKGSIWWRILLFLLKGSNLVIRVESTPRQLLIQAKDIDQQSELSDTYASNAIGFEIALDQLISDLGKKSGNIPVSKTYPYYITAHPEHYVPTSLKAVVQPDVIRKTSKGHARKVFFLKIFINAVTKDASVLFFRK